MVSALDETPEQAFMPTGQQVMPPMGFVGFCLQQPNACAGGTDAPLLFQLTPIRRAQLDSVNAAVNSLPEVSDMAHYGRDEVWAYADAQGGDCEDLALEKRRRLIAMHWPADMLLIATAKDETGGGHAVLIATTSQGDLVLDNRAPTIKLWSAAPYHWTARQSRLRPFIWLSVDATRFAATPVAHYPPLGEPAPFLAQRIPEKIPASIKQTVLASLVF